MKQAQEYMEAQIMEFPGVIVRVHRPVLEEAERERRMKRIRKAAERVLAADSRKER